MVTASKPNNAQAEKFGLPENAVEVSPGVFYLGKSMDNGKVVEGYAFVHYAKGNEPVTKSKPAWDDTYDKYKFLFPQVELKWANTMQYEVDLTGIDFVGDGDVMTILEDSLEEWDDETQFELFDTPIEHMDIKNPGVKDNCNVVGWRNLGSSGTIAMNSLWFDTTTMNIIESDVTFNTYYIWSTSDTPVGDVMDLQSIATHEFGHNGLGDLYSSPSVKLTMHGWSYGFGETHKRDLGTGDISGIQALYGE